MQTGLNRSFGRPSTVLAFSFLVTFAVRSQSIDISLPYKASFSTNHEEKSTQSLSWASQLLTSVASGDTSIAFFGLWAAHSACPFEDGWNGAVVMKARNFADLKAVLLSVTRHLGSPCVANNSAKIECPPG
ncbi:hypothetical protein T08_11006 [Trichinella sp. T8]|nr:hypothetical protein T08_11006 [Trichinella sp. T8]